MKFDNEQDAGAWEDMEDFDDDFDDDFEEEFEEELVDPDDSFLNTGPAKFTPQSADTDSAGNNGA